MPPDSSEIDAALVGRLAGDPALAAIMPDGVYFDEAPANLRQFVIVALLDETDTALFVQGRAIDDATYLVKAVSFGTSGSAVKAAAARIDQLLDDHALVAAGFACMTVHREKRIRYPEVDDLDPSIRWQHRGGHYRVQMAIDLSTR